MDKIRNLGVFRVIAYGSFATFVFLIVLIFSLIFLGGSTFRSEIKAQKSEYDVYQTMLNLKFEIADIHRSALRFLTTVNGREAEQMEGKINYHHVKVLERISSLLSNKNISVEDKKIIKNIDGETTKIQTSIFEALKLAKNGEAKAGLIELRPVQESVAIVDELTSFLIDKREKSLKQKMRLVSNQNVKYISAISIFVILSSIAIIFIWIWMKRKFKEVESMINAIENASKNVSEITERVEYAIDSMANSSFTQIRAVKSTSESIKLTMDKSESNLEVSNYLNKELEDFKEKIKKLSKSTYELKKSIMNFAKNEKEIQSLHKGFESIFENLRMMEEISDQTRMLAVNASIEAEASGEFGGGFAIVAAEVGKLAQKTNMTAARIGENVQKLGVQSKSAIELSKSTIGEGVDTLDKLEANIFSFVEETGTVLTNVSRINQSAKDQSDIISSLSEATETIHKHAEKNYALSKDLVSVRDKLAEESMELRWLSENFKKYVGGLKDENSF